MVRFNPALLEELVATGISTFTTADIPDLSGRFPQASYWLVNHFLNNVLRAKFGPGYQQLAVGYIRRSHHAFASFHRARDLTLEYLSRGEPMNPDVGVYYNAIAEWEAFVLHAQMAMDLFRKFNQDVGAFVRGNGSAHQRLYDVGNRIKHAGDFHRPGPTRVADIVPLWLTNDGLQSFALAVSYVEAGNVLGDIAELADEMHDARRFAENTRAINAAEAAEQQASGTAESA